MRNSYARLVSSLVLLIASSASAVTMDWTPIGDLGNACDPQWFNTTCYGSVSYGYSIGTYEVTNAQYAEFLNAKAASDPLGLYNPYMANFDPDRPAGITRSGSSGSYVYNAIAGRENMPVNLVSFFDAARFANWMNNGQGSGDTETGAYTLLGGTAIPSNGSTVTRNAGAIIALPSEDEWFKAAYYSPAGVYFDYPTGWDTPTICGAPTGAANHANCNDVMMSPVPVGSYPGSASPYGTYDQGGNVWEWNEAINVEFGVVRHRIIRGGTYGGSADQLAAGWRSTFPFSDGEVREGESIGFRLAMIPEPGTGLLVIAGLVGLAGGRRARD